jgi:hypothetical protein
MTKKPRQDYLKNEIILNHSNDLFIDNNESSSSSSSSSSVLINGLIDYCMNTENETTKLNQVLKNTESNKSDGNGSSIIWCDGSKRRSSCYYTVTGEIEHNYNTFDIVKESYEREIIQNLLNCIIDQIESNFNDKNNNNNISTSKSILYLNNNDQIEPITLFRHDYSNEDNNKNQVQTIVNRVSTATCKQNLSSIIPTLNNLINSSKFFELFKSEDKANSYNSMIMNPINDPFYELKQNWLNKYKVNKVNISLIIHF